MFIWAKIPEIARDMGSMKFSKQLLTEAKVAVSPGIGFGEHGDEYVSIALIENENRIQTSCKKYKKVFKSIRGKEKLIAF